ncbi:MAG: choline-sulfatase, partial [Planctomycetota bacterium]
MHSCPNFKSAIASSHPAVVRLFGALLWAVLGLSCGAESKVEQRPRNVILICWDTVRADHLGPYGYSLRPTTPALDALATRSTVFTDASATAGWTKPSVPSILTGLMPAEHGVFEGSASFELGKTTDVLPESAVTLAEVFQGRGFRTAAFVKNAQLRPGNGFEQGFETYRDEVGDARDIRWAGLDWLDSLQPEDSFFLYLHALDAHWPYAIPDAAAKRFVELERVRMFQEKSFKEIVDRIQDGEREFSADERNDLLALYDGAISYLDQQLGFLIEGLALRGLEEDTVIVLVSDHG